MDGYTGIKDQTPSHVTLYLLGKKRSVESLWRDFFLNTSKWWDHRPEKTNPRFPDFKHKQTQESLWLGDARNPPWVQAELVAILPGTLQCNAFVWTQRLKRLVKARQYMETIQVFHRMQQEKICPDSHTFLPVLNACAGLGALEEGRRVHTQIIHVGCETDVRVSTCLVDMYAKCGSIEEAWVVFNRMQDRDVVTWNAMIGGYVKSGQGLKALDLFQEMKQAGNEPDAVTFVGLLNACASITALGEGRSVHEQIILHSCESNVYVANCLVDMYGKCGSIEDAWSVFNKMQDHDVITWNAMIGGCVKSGQGLKAMELFHQMRQERVEPNAVTCVGLLNACASLAALEEGRHIHQQAIQVGCESDVYVISCLIDMYAECGSLAEAWSVFNKIKDPDVVAWSAMIGGYVKFGEWLNAMELFQKMQQQGVEPNAVTYLEVLKACASSAALDEGRHVHSQIIQGGYQSDVYVATCLVDMYAKCRSMEDAWSVFKQMVEHNVVTWNALIGGYVKTGQELKALELFRQMQQEGLEPDTVTFVEILNACAGVAALEEGRCVHEQISQRGCETNVFVATCLVDMYAKCGSIEDACSVFNKMAEHNVVTWNAMIGGYAKSEEGLKALELFNQMQQEGVKPNAVTFVGVLSACASLGALEVGRWVHTQIIQVGCESDVYVANCLVDMYAKCGSIKDAWSVFDKMPEHNVITWNSMIGGYVKSGQGMKAMELFWEMQQEGLEPDSLTFIGILNACSSVAALEEGRRVHEQIILKGCGSDVYVSNCLVNMYTKCGSIEEAHGVFDKMQEHDVETWNAMIGGYAKHGQAKKAIGLFQLMGKEGVEVNGITFTCLLSACSHGGLVKEGLRYFKSMSLCFDIHPTIQHYACMVDLLGRAGRLEEAQELMRGVPIDTDACMCMALLGSGRIHGNIEMAERAAKQCWELDPGADSGHVLLSNIAAAA